MKKIHFISILFGLILTSCITSTYVFKFSDTPGIDFRKGKWLLNEIESPYIIRPQLREIVKKEFSNHLKSDFFILNQTNGLMLPPKTPLNPNKQILKEIKAGTKFDYFINLKTKILKDEVGALSIGTPDVRDSYDGNDFDDNDESKVEVTLEVYDLNRLKIIYSQTVFGSSQFNGDSEGVYLSKGTNSLIVSSLRRIIKKIEKNHK
jgi:hypothetical protein